jgi:hypothetical protein
VNTTLHAASFSSALRTLSTRDGRGARATTRGSPRPRGSAACSGGSSRRRTSFAVTCRDRCVRRVSDISKVEEHRLKRTLEAGVHQLLVVHR